MGKLLDSLEVMTKGPLTHGFFEDFDHMVTADRWTSVLTDSGSATVGDAAGGVITLTPSDGTVGDNDEAYLHTTKEIFKFAANKPGFVEARLQFTEANTDDANVMFGLADTSAANHIQDNGAGPLASYSGAVFFKVDGGTLWNTESSIAGTQTTNLLNAATSLDKTAKTAGGASYQTLRIEWLPKPGSLMDVMFFIDGVLVDKHENVDITSATEMDVFVGVKNGDTNVEALLVDYIQAWQTR